MKRKAFLCSFLALLSGGFAMADTGQTVTINGATVDKFVTELAFSGDNVTLTFDDNSSQTEDLSLVTIDLTYTTSGIEVSTKADKTLNSRVYSISGQYVGNSTSGLQKGVYIVNGKKIVVK